MGNRAAHLPVIGIAYVITVGWDLAGDAEAGKEFVARIGEFERIAGGSNRASATAVIEPVLLDQKIPPVQCHVGLRAIGSGKGAAHVEITKIAVFSAEAVVIPGVQVRIGHALAQFMRD